MGVSRATAGLSEVASAENAGEHHRHSRDWAVRRLLAAGDLLAVLLALLGAVLIAADRTQWQSFVWGLPAVPMMLFLFKLYGLYDRDAKRIVHTTTDDLPWLVHAALVGSLALWAYSSITPLGDIGYGAVLLFGVVSVLLVAAVRATLRGAMRRLIAPERTLVVGGGDGSDALVKTLGSHPEYQLLVIGSLVHARSPQRITEGPLATRGSIKELSDVARRDHVGRVVVSSNEVGDDELEELLRECRRLGLKVSVLPRLSEVLGSAVVIDDLRGVTVLGLNPPWLTRSSRTIKRITDIAIATILLVLFLPLLAVVAVLIKVESPGPVLFLQERVGKGGRRFRLLKLRTMIADAEKHREGLLHLSTDQEWLRLADDPRVTRLGRRLRRFSIDELPQLWNVLHGDMSMVGPRPLIPAEDERVNGWGRDRLDLVPGMTGYWQVMGRTEIPFEEMVKLDYLYVVNWSLWQDIRLILRTLPAVLRGRGAN